MLRLAVVAFIVSAVVGFFTIRWAHLHAHLTADRLKDGSHKIHKVEVPRVGGVGIFAGWLVALAASVALGPMAGIRAATWLTSRAITDSSRQTERCGPPHWSCSVWDHNSRRAPRFRRRFRHSFFRLSVP